jgi:sugar phosphate isomerase/epimerase
MNQILKTVQVHIPFSMLCEGHLEKFLKNSINPEIGIDAQSLDSVSFSEFRDIAQEIKSHHLTVTIHAPFVDLSPGSPDPKVREATRFRFRQLLEVVALFKPKIVVCHAGYDEGRYWYLREIWIEKSLETWSWFGGKLRQKGARLTLENVFERVPDEIRELTENLKNLSVGVCFDIGHQAVYSNVSVEKWLSILGPYIHQLHLHDNSGKEDEHLALGLGNIDFRKLFKKLTVLRKDPPIITLEPYREEDLWVSLEYLERHWPW